MFLSNGNPTEAVDVMQYCWTGKWPQYRAPSIRNISLDKIGWRKDHVLAPSAQATLSIEWKNTTTKKLLLNICYFQKP